LDPLEKQLIEWQTYKNVALDGTVQQKREKKKGTDKSTKKTVTKCRLVYEKTSMSDFKLHVLVTMKEFIVHNFRA
jgi:hypothetical protein